MSIDLPQPSELVKGVELTRSTAPKAGKHLGAVAVISLILEAGYGTSEYTKTVYPFY